MPSDDELEEMADPTDRHHPPARPTGLAAVVADNIRVEAGRIGITQQQLATCLGMSRSAVSLRYRYRVPWRVNELETVAFFLNVPVAELMTKPRHQYREPPVWGSWT